MGPDDPATSNMVLFGTATAGSQVGTTWTWNGLTGLQRSPIASPPSRSGSSMAYDPATWNLVLFGGDVTTTTFLGDTWTWTGATWTLRARTTSPPTRYGASMAYNP